MGSWRPTLATWTVATFNVTVFVLLLLLIGYPTGVVSDVLPGLDTLVGVAVFVYLWALAVLLTARLIGGISVVDSSLWTVSVRAVAAGAAIGVAFFLGFLAVVAVQSLIENPAVLGVVALVGLLGGAVAAVIGGVVGLAFGLFDVALYRIADALLAPIEDGPAETGDGATTADRP